MTAPVNQLGTLVFNESKGYGEVRLSQEFYASDWVVQADFLLGVQVEIETLYDSLFVEPHRSNGIRAMAGKRILKAARN